MLPGKLCIGILEEDNPLKAYFRLKPLIIETEGKFEACDTLKVYPGDGCIRIVPDKNESGYFKARMRQMGKYCVVDLREHTGSNDKIRPNKNYRGNEIENNAYIIYSDVVREPAENMIFEIVPEEYKNDWTGETPSTHRILFGEDLSTWKMIVPEDENTAPRIERDGKSLPADRIQKFDLNGFGEERIHIAICLPEKASDMIAAPAPNPTAAFKPAEPAPKPMERPPMPPEKPWLNPDMPLPPPPPVHRGNPLDKRLAAQSGLNPRRNRSLQEIIEDKWRHSRVDQLGHPIPANAMGRPIEDPVERAVNAVRNAWENQAVRMELMQKLAAMREFSLNLEERKRQLNDLALKRELEELEAERLKALADIDNLHRQKNALRAKFIQEIREEEADALKAYTESTRLAKEECEKNRREADAARRDAEFAQDAFAALNDGRFEKQLREHILMDRAADILGRAEKKPCRASDERPDRAQWIQRTIQAFAMEGISIDEIEAANLLVCVAMNNRIILSGSASSDKVGYARAIARALGAGDSDRYTEIHGKIRDVDITAEDDLPTVAYVHEANAQPGRDIYAGISQKDRNLIVIAGAMDSGSGFPLNAESMERAFMLRLQPAAEDMPWKPAVRKNIVFSPVRMHTLRDAFCIEAAEMPLAMERRMQKFRSELARYGVRLSRNTLDQLWGYCSAMLALNRLPLEEILDRAIAQKALPCILAEAPVECLRMLSEMLADMPKCLSLLAQPLPIMI